MAQAPKNLRTALAIELPALVPKELAEVVQMIDRAGEIDAVAPGIEPVLAGRQVVDVDRVLGDASCPD